jgi:hypothetical protein
MDNIRIQDKQILNQVIHELNKKITCGAKCQEEKKKEKLKQKFVDAKNNLINGEENLNNARKQYFMYAFGQAKFNEEIEDVIRKKIDKFADTEQINHNKQIQNLDQLDDENKQKQQYVKNLKDLLTKYNLGNKEYDEDIIKYNNKNNIAYRKVDYENKQIDGLDFYYTILGYFEKLTLVIYVAMFINYGLYKSFRNIIILSIILLFTVRHTLLYYFKKLYILIVDNIL